MKKKVLFITLGLVMVTALGAAGMSSVKADNQDFYPPIVGMIADKFNLNEDEVKSVFDEERQNRQQLRLQDKEERLSQAVSDGIITEDQRKAIVAKQQELLQERDQRRNEMQLWLGEQGIDTQALMQYHRMGMGKGGFGPGDISN